MKTVKSEILRFPNRAKAVLRLAAHRAEEQGLRHHVGVSGGRDLVVVYFGRQLMLVLQPRVSDENAVLVSLQSGGISASVQFGTLPLKLGESFRRLKTGVSDEQLQEALEFYKGLL